MRVASLVGLLILTLPAPAAAQAAPPPPPPPRQEGTAEVAFVGTSGNASTNTFSISGEHIARPTPWLFKNRVAFIRNKAEDVKTAESLLYGLRTERAVTPRLAVFGEYVYFHDAFAGVDHRNGVTAGLAVKLVDHAAHKLAADAGLGYLNEQRLAGEDVSSATYGFGGSYRWTISPTATLEDDSRLIGTFDNADDWRFVNLVSLTARLTQLLSLKVSNTVRYAHFPPPGFKTTDTTTSIALVAKFTRQ